MSSRRKFIRNGSLGSIAISLGGLTLPASSFSQIMGSNDRINCAVVGVRSRGKAHVSAIHNDPNARVLYNCDVDNDILQEQGEWCRKTIGYIPKAEKDFRKILEDKEVDAVFIATPEHWHTPMSILAMQAGKHVYVEKPCSHNPHENNLITQAQKKYGVKVQMGNQQRSAISTQHAIADIRAGIIGEVYKGEAYYSNNRGSIGRGKDIPVPESLDWELWQGPAPRMNYKSNVHPYNWHWFRNWGTGEIHNNGTHEIDICRWALNVDLPKTVTSFGGKYTFDDDWEFPDNQQVTYQFANDKFITWTGHSRGLLKPERPGRGITIYGSKGTIQLDRNYYKLFDLNGQPIKFEFEKASSATTDTRGEGLLDLSHVGNFFDGIRKDSSLNADIQDASISTMLCHLGNIAQDVGETIRIDSDSGKILDNERAMKNWKRDYESGWEPKL